MRILPELQLPCGRKSGAYLAHCLAPGTLGKRAVLWLDYAEAARENTRLSILTEFQKIKDTKKLSFLAGQHECRRVSHSAIPGFNATKGLSNHLLRTR